MLCVFNVVMMVLCLVCDLVVEWEFWYISEISELCESRLVSSWVSMLLFCMWVRIMWKLVSSCVWLGMLVILSVLFLFFRCLCSCVICVGVIVLVSLVIIVYFSICFILKICCVFLMLGFVMKVLCVGVSVMSWLWFSWFSVWCMRVCEILKMFVSFCLVSLVLGIRCCLMIVCVIEVVMWLVDEVGVVVFVFVVVDIVC